MYCTKCHSEISNCCTYLNFFDDQLSFHSMPSLPHSFKCCQTSNSISLTLCPKLSLNSKFNLQFAILAFAMHVLCLFLSDGKFYDSNNFYSQILYFNSRNLSYIFVLSCSPDPTTNSGTKNPDFSNRAKCDFDKLMV